MLIIVCPYCGKRPEIEFTYGGEAHLVRPKQPSQVNDQEWADFLYMRANTKGAYAERWRHSHGCGRFFNAIRDTTTDHFLAFYKSGEAPPALAGAVGAGAAGTGVASVGADPVQAVTGERTP